MKIYRQATSASAPWNVIKTIASLMAVSALGFWIIPVVIVHWQEHYESLDWLRFPGQRWPGVVLIIGGGVLFCWSALTLAIIGRGTPLPFDAPRQLVVKGPYARVRNPMVTAALIIGVGSGFILGSTLVIAFFVVLVVVWNFTLRLDDERRLERAFGRPYVFYRRSVRCWLPHRRAWAPPEVTAPISIEELADPSRRRRR